MVIFQVINNIALDVYGGGAELFALRLIEELQLNNDCHLIIVWRYNTNQENETIECLSKLVNFHFLAKSNKRNLQNFFHILKKFSKLIRKHSPQVINSHSALPDLINCSMKLFVDKRIKSIRTVHTDKKWFNSRMLEFLFGDLLFPLVFDLEIAISKATQTRLDRRWIEKIQKKNCVIINNGISKTIIEQSRRSNSNRVKQKSENYKIITIGRLSEQKGYQYLLEAISLIKESFKFNLYIFGEGAEKEFLIQKSRNLNIDNFVYFMGYQSDVLDFMSECDLFVSSSLWEGFPTVILEAMALRIPVVATNVSGSRELIINNSTGILVQPKQPKELANAITKVINSPEQARLFAENAFKSLQEFTIEKVAEKYMIAYRDLV